MTRAAPVVREVVTKLPPKLMFLMELHPYKVAYGGRFGLKTRSFAIALLNLGATQKLRILCCREVMTSIKDSVHEELKALIEALGLQSFYKVLETEIRGRNGTTFIFAGLHGSSATGIKSYGNLDIVWVEEAQAVVKRSWDVLIPTVRAENSEIWVSFNPDMDTDDTWKRWVERPPPGAVVVKTGWQDAAELGWFPANENNKRLHCLKYEPDDYDNIWEGAPRTVVAGAIYTREILAMIEERRIRPTPYDPRLPVHRIWDLGWNDAMSIIMVQKTTPTTVNIINYREDSGRRYDELIEDFRSTGYRWGIDWMPHDAEQHHPTSGTNAKKTLEGLGCRVRIVPRSDPEARIRAARMMFPRVYIDDTERPCDSGHYGAGRLIECLKRYKRNIPKITGEPMAPTHDQYSHGADSYGSLAEIVDQIRNDVEARKLPVVPRYRSSVRGAGFLG
jgi:phage terminase large subunit